MKKIHQDNLDEKFVSRRQGFDGRLLKVMVDTVTLPNGRQTTREIIAHPGQYVLCRCLTTAALFL